jgi:predicted ribosome quality control (RQC) complex YloA/Tae2 family protein
LLLREIKDELLGAFIEEVRINDRIVQLVLNERSLFLSLYPTALGLYVSERCKSGYEPLKNMSNALKSCRIVEIMQRDFMPVLNIGLERSFPDHEELHIIVSFYPQAPNLSLKMQDWQKNIFSRYIDNRPKSSILELKAEQLTGVTADYVVKNFEGIDKKMARELDPDNLRILKEILSGNDVRPKLVSASPLHVSLFASKYEEAYDSFNVMFKAALSVFLREQEKKEAIQQKHLAVKNMRRRVARLQKKLLSTEAIEEIRLYGELILANIRKIRKGMTKIVLQNPYTQSGVEIELDPQLTPQVNAQRYFSRYKKEKRGQPQLREQIKKITKRINDLQAQPLIRRTGGKKLKSEATVKEPFHRFSFESGSVVFVGKNARSNDELTFKYAHPGDYFFHTRGYEGAHVILRPNIPKGQRPNREEIRSAASIAAYFSKARKQSNVPVSYTQRKFLKKNKKGKRGSVILMREEVIFVEPGLPPK